MSGGRWAKVPTAPEIFGGQVGEGPHRARDLPNRRLVERAVEANALAAHLLGEDQQLEPEGGGLGVDAVGAADARRVAELQRAGAECLVHPVHAGLQQAPGVPDLEPERRVEHVARRHAVVDEARRRPHVLGDVGQEGDHVVAHGGLDLRHPRRVHRGLRPDLFEGLRGHEPALGLDLADRELDVEPAPVASLLGPDGRHLGSGVAFDHEVPTCRYT
jgi:hypothetical protein